MQVDELENLIKSKDKSWSLGQEGDAQFLELSNTGVASAMEVEMHLQRKAQEITRAIMHDPDKIVGAAQSAKAMEVLNGPLVELINELRPMFGKHLIKLVKKIVIICNSGDVTNAIKWRIPDGFDIEQDKINLEWGEIFPPSSKHTQHLSLIHI